MRIHVTWVLVLGLSGGGLVWSEQPEESSVQKYAQAQEFRTIIEQAKQKVYPALVFVKPIREEFSAGEKKRQEVFGSGVIISPDGFVVTNNHVVDRAIEIRAVLSDKRQMRAELIGKDAETDLALIHLLELGGGELLPYAEFADSDAVEAGDFVMALGSPFGFARSISLGIVSNTERYLGFESSYLYNNFLQTDAAINPGNSGGPLVDINGQIVGINTLAVPGGQGLGFSVPSNVAKDIIERLRLHGRVDRAWTGLKLQPLRDYNTNTFTDSDVGVLVSHVEADSPAEKAGTRAGDILLEVNGSPVLALYAEDLPAVRRTLADLAIGRESKFVLARGTEAVTLTFSPTLKGSIDLADFSCERWNMTVKEFNEFSEPDLYFYHKGGVYVNGVRRPGNASSSGLLPRDIILKLDGKEVSTVTDVRQIYESLVADEKRRARVLIEIQRGAFTQLVVLDYKEDFLK